MSLTCAIYKSQADLDREYTGEDEWIALRGVGPESYGRSFYGSQVVKDLGLTIVPQIGPRGVEAGGELLGELEREIRIMCDNIGIIAQATGGDAENYKSRLRIILELIELAKSNNYIVSIG